MATEPPNSTSSSKPSSYSHWADPRIKHLWQAARDKLTAGEPLAPPRMTPVVVSTIRDRILLKEIASLVKYPSIHTVERLSSDEKWTGETVLVSLLSEEAISRLDGYIADSEEYLVSLSGILRYAYRFRENAQVQFMTTMKVSITSQEPIKTTQLVRVLSLDGCTTYIQAMQQLSILDRLMSKTNGTLETGDVFELIGGVGISGLVSVLLGYPNSTISKCWSLLNRLPIRLDLDRLEDILKKEMYNFSKPQDDVSSDGEDLYSGGRNLAASDSEDDQPYLSESVGMQSSSEEEETDLNKPFMSDIEGQNIFVKANVLNRQEEILLRTYYGHDPQLISEKISILDAIRSTIAAVGPLSPAKPSSSQHGKKSVYGGPFGLQTLPQRPETQWNNPIYDAYREARSIWLDRDVIIVSIGVKEMPFSSILQSDSLVRRFKRDHPDVGEDNLFRFLPDSGLRDSLFTQCAKRLAIYSSPSLSRTLSEEGFRSSSGDDREWLGPSLGWSETDLKKNTLADKSVGTKT